MDTQTFRQTLTDIATEDSLNIGKLYALSKLDEAQLAIFREVWPTIDTDRRQAIMRELAEIVETNFEVNFDPVFLLALDDPAAEVRAHAIQGLWEYDDPVLIPPLVHLLLTDEAESVRAAAALALGRFVYWHEMAEISPIAILPAHEALVQTFQNPQETIEVRRRTVEALSFSSDPAVPNFIETAYYDDEHDKMRVSAVFAMGRSADPRWIPLIRQELKSKNTEIRFEATRAAGEMEITAAIPRLHKIARRDPDSEVQLMAVWALGRIGGKDAHQILEALARSSDESIALAAEEALEELLMFQGAIDMFDFGDDEDIEDYIDEFGFNQDKFSLN